MAKTTLDYVLQFFQSLSIISAGILVIVYWVKQARSPQKKQNERLDALEKWKDHVDKCLDNDKANIEELREGNRVMQQGMLALIQNAIEKDGKADPKLVEASNRLEKYLIER